MRIRTMLLILGELKTSELALFFVACCGHVEIQK